MTQTEAPYMPPRYTAHVVVALVSPDGSLEGSEVDDDRPELIQRGEVADIVEMFQRKFRGEDAVVRVMNVHEVAEYTTVEYMPDATDLAAHDWTEYVLVETYPKKHEDEWVVVRREEFPRVVGAAQTKYGAYGMGGANIYVSCLTPVKDYEVGVDELGYPLDGE